MMPLICIFTLSFQSKNISALCKLTDVLRSPTPTPVLATPQARTPSSQLRQGHLKAHSSHQHPVTLTPRIQDTHWPRSFPIPLQATSGLFLFLPSINFSCIDFDAHVSGSLKYRLNPNISKRQMVTRDISLPQATPDLGHSGDCTEAVGPLSFVPERSVYALVVTEQTQ